MWKRKLIEDGKQPSQPQKKYYRSRAHCNPLSHNDGFRYPLKPEDMNWTSHYPLYASDNNLNLSKPVTVLDIGCGFGGLTVSLAELLPENLILAMEIRAKVCEFVRLRIEGTLMNS
jgi:tRNA (guanine-N7-)-methyltransferase